MINNHHSDTELKSIRPLKGEQSNTSIIFNDTLIMKNFRRLNAGKNPDLEIPLFLTTHTSFNNMPRIAGYIEYAGDNGFQSYIASLQHFIPNEGDGWKYSLEHLHSLYAYAVSDSHYVIGTTHASELEKTISQHCASYLHSLSHLGKVTGELHNTLASDYTNPDFMPEVTSAADVKRWIDHACSYADAVLKNLSNVQTYSSPIGTYIQRIIASQSILLEKLRALHLLSDQGVFKIRYHNDYHLGQVLKTGDDFIIIDFEGEPARSLEERREKQSPLKDVAGMLRSVNYAVSAAIFDMNLTAKQKDKVELWGSIWEKQVHRAFLDGYLMATAAQDTRFLPASKEDIATVLTAFQLDKALYEINYEINNRPSWLEIPLKYVYSICNSEPKTT